MKAKTIKAVLQKKHNEFLSSIEDETVKKRVAANSIITGGCIVSMLLGEKVNDFDYYFRDFETALAVASYYADRFTKEYGGEVGVRVLDDVSPKRVKLFVRSKGIEGNIPDAETESIEAVGLGELIEKEEPAELPKYRPVYLTSNAITLSNKIQLVVRFYGEPEEIHKNYDFVHCTCYWDSKTGNLVLPAGALESILTKELRYVGSLYPLCSLFRIRKFVQRGWTINAGQVLKMALHLNEMDLLDIEVLEDQLIGVDSAYFMDCISRIKEAAENDDNFKLTAPYLFSIIDKIF